MKKLAVLYFFLFSSVLFSQDAKTEEQQSKMLDFVSQTGVILKFQDYELPKVKLNYGIAESKIRKIISGEIGRSIFYKYQKRVNMIQKLHLLHMKT